jgi:hypothetical protein
MSRLTREQSARVRARERGRRRGWLYKADYPRHIDRYIDFFGTGSRQAGLPAVIHDVVLRSLA